jgi:hypothetical protein
MSWLAHRPCFHKPHNTGEKNTKLVTKQILLSFRYLFLLQVLLLSRTPVLNTPSPFYLIKTEHSITYDFINIHVT